MSESDVTQIRRALAAADRPLTVAELCARCDCTENTTRIASVMHEEVRTGRAERSGERGSYRYQITESGRAVARNPRLMRASANRRRARTQRGPLRPGAVVDLAAGEPTAPSPTATAARPHERAEPASAATTSGEFARRLAAFTLAQWPGPHSTIPDPLASELERALAMEDLQDAPRHPFAPRRAGVRESLDTRVHNEEDLR